MFNVIKRQNDAVATLTLLIPSQKELSNIPSPPRGTQQHPLSPSRERVRVRGIIATSRKIRVENFHNVWHIRI